MSFYKAVENIKTFFRRERGNFNGAVVDECLEIDDPLWWMFVVSGSRRSEDELLSGSTPRYGETLFRLLTGDHSNFKAFDKRFANGRWVTPLDRLVQLLAYLVAHVDVLPQIEFPETDQWTLGLLKERVLNGNANVNGFKWKVVEDVLRTTRKSTSRETVLRLLDPFAALVSATADGRTTVSTLTQLVTAGNAHRLVKMNQKAVTIPEFSAALRYAVTLPFAGDSRITLDLGEIRASSSNFTVDARVQFHGVDYCAYTVVRNGGEESTLIVTLTSLASESMVTSKDDRISRDFAPQQVAGPIHSRALITWALSSEMVHVTVFEVEKLVGSFSTLYGRSLEQRVPAKVLDMLARSALDLLAGVRTFYRHNNVLLANIVYAEKRRRWAFVDMYNESANNECKPTWLGHIQESRVVLPPLWDMLCFIVDLVRRFPSSTVHARQLLASEYFEGSGVNLTEENLFSLVYEHAHVMNDSLMAAGDLREERAIHEEEGVERYSFEYRADRKRASGRWTVISDLRLFTKRHVALTSLQLRRHGIVYLRNAEVRSRADELDDDRIAVQCKLGTRTYSDASMYVAPSWDRAGDRKWRAHVKAAHHQLAIPLLKCFTEDELSLAVLTPCQRDDGESRFLGLLKKAKDASKEVWHLLNGVFVVAQELYKKAGLIHHDLLLKRFSWPLAEARPMLTNLRRAWHTKDFDAPNANEDNHDYPLLLQDGMTRESGRAHACALAIAEFNPLYDVASLLVDVVYTLGRAEDVDHDVKLRIRNHLFEQVLRGILGYEDFEKNRFRESGHPWVSRVVLSNVGEGDSEVSPFNDFSFSMANFEERPMFANADGLPRSGGDVRAIRRDNDNEFKMCIEFTNVHVDDSTFIYCPGFPRGLPLRSMDKVVVYLTSDEEVATPVSSSSSSSPSSSR